MPIVDYYYRILERGAPSLVTFERSTSAKWLIGNHVETGQGNRLIIPLFEFYSEDQARVRDYDSSGPRPEQLEEVFESISEEYLRSENHLVAAFDEERPIYITLLFRELPHLYDRSRLRSTFEPLNVYHAYTTIVGTCISEHPPLNCILMDGRPFRSAQPLSTQMGSIPPYLIEYGGPFKVFAEGFLHRFALGQLDAIQLTVMIQADFSVVRVPGKVVSDHSLKIWHHSTEEEGSRQYDYLKELNRRELESYALTEKIWASRIDLLMGS